MSEKKTLVPHTKVQPVKNLAPRKEKLPIKGGTKKTTRTVRPHVLYNDLTSNVKVYLPTAKVQVSVPSNRTGLGAKMYAPAVMLHSIVESIITQKYAALKAGQVVPPTLKQLKELAGLLNDTSELLERSWNMGEKGTRSKGAAAPDGSKTLAPLIQGTVNIKSAVFGKDQNKTTLEEAMNRIKSIEVEAEDVVAQMQEEAEEESDLSKDEMEEIHKQYMAELKKRGGMEEVDDDPTVSADDQDEDEDEQEEES